MNEIAEQLKKLIIINRKINNQLNRDEADLGMLEGHFAQREKHVKEFVRLSSEVETSSLTHPQKESLNTLFNRFEKQSLNMQSALDYIADESRDRLNQAIKQTKAEQSYQLLKR